jgi:hypothetical protein
MAFIRWLAAVAAGALIAAGAASSTLTSAAAADDDLPEGEGKKILLAACRHCHELDEVTKFRGYYDRSQWRDVVVTMKEYGAPVDERQVEVLTDYLTTHLGRQ